MSLRGELVRIPGYAGRPRTRRAELRAVFAGADVRRLLWALERETFVVLALAFAAVLLLLRASTMLVTDSWLTFVAGREIGAHGIPAVDSLTIWGNGVEWIDQQWLAQLAYHGVVALGGLPLALIANVALIVAASALVVAAARHGGASATSVAAVAPLVLFVVLPSTALRAQTLAFPLFAALVWLLVNDARAPSRKVFLVAPLLILWANLHGSVVLGAGLVALAGGAHALEAALRRKVDGGVLARSALLACMPWACLFVSPYGPSLVDYYRNTIGNPVFARAVGEWGGASYPNQLPFFVLLIGGLWLAARYGQRLTVFERLLFVATAAAGVVAIRNIVWFAFVALAVLPHALDELWPRRGEPRRNPRLNLTLCGLAAVAVTSAVVATAVRPASWFEEAYPRPAADAVSAAAAADPASTVYANERYASWLMWRDPALRGRIAYDARFELLTGAQIDAAIAFRDRKGADWQRAIEGYAVVVLDSQEERLVREDLLATGSLQPVYGDDHVSVLVRKSGDPR